jgi:hypothetical protein
MVIIAPISYSRRDRHPCLPQPPTQTTQHPSTHPPTQVPDWFPTWLITLAQILQMVVGVFVAFNYYRVLSAGGSCAVSTDLLWACAVMYSTYLYLFVEFAVKRCVRALFFPVS